MKGRKTGGRKASTPNKATSTLHEQVEQEAGAPLPILLTRIGVKAMRDGDSQLAVNALSKAATYVYPRMGSMDPPPQRENIVVTFGDALPCRSCGHDPSKPDVIITREIYTGNAPNGSDPT